MGKKFTTILKEADAASRRARRERLRREREQARLVKAAERAAELAHASAEAAAYEEELQALLSIHRRSSEVVDWVTVLSAPAPTPPQRSAHNELKATAAFDNYEPSTLHKFLRRVEKTRLQLQAAIEAARTEDEHQYSMALQSFEAATSEWTNECECARKILDGDLDSYVAVLSAREPFKELTQLGAEVEVAFESPLLAAATLYVPSSDIIPNESRSLLKSGKLSVKAVPKTKHLAMYQDYVCGAALRVGRETTALLPVSHVIVTAVTDLLNTSTGHLEESSVLSIAMPRRTMEKLNFELLDPSDAMTNFVHNMKFLRTRGFSLIDPIASTELDLS